MTLPLRGFNDGMTECKNSWHIFHLLRDSIICA
jgi:hypothetical protein